MGLGDLPLIAHVGSAIGWIVWAIMGTTRGVWMAIPSTATALHAIAPRLSI